MIHVVAKAVVRSEMQEKYIKIASELVKMTLEEDGCISYGLYQENDNSDILTFIEIWRDKDCLEKHFKTPHFTELVPRLGELRDSSEVNIYSLIK